MEFSLDDEQITLKNVVRRYLQSKCTTDIVKEMIEDEKGYSPLLWMEIAKLGWTGILIEEKYGGAGGRFSDLSIVLEEMGRFLFPSPFFSTVILGGIIIALGGSEVMKEKLLPGIAKGDVIITLSLMERGLDYSMEEIESYGEKGEMGYFLKGRKMFVPDANIAHYIILPVRSYEGNRCNGISLFCVYAKSEGLVVKPIRSLSLQKQFEVCFSGVNAPKDSLIGVEGLGETLMNNLWPIMVTGKCCEMLGAMQKVFEMTLEFSKMRHQFGRPLSAFQVIQHYCADMAIDVECSKVVVNQAVSKIDKALPAKKEVSMAKAWCSESLKKVVTMSHQIHGGIGFTKEHSLYLYFRYAKAAEVAFGDANFHKELVAREMDVL